MVRPILKISPSINHLWVNASGDEIINAPGLLNFTRHSDLGRVVQAVIRELQRRPPLITGHVPNNVSILYYGCYFLMYYAFIKIGQNNADVSVILFQ